MAIKPTPARNPLASKPAEWKKKNFNTSITVPASAIQKLQANKTKSANVKAYSGTKSAVMKEAMNRFYGKGWESSAAKKKAAPSAGWKGAKNNRMGGRLSPAKNVIRTISEKF